MIRLNLPSYPIKLSGTKEKPHIFDILRRKYVALTPEEWVRQHFMLANEIPLKSGSKVLRADSVLYDRELRPRMIIEYKAPSISISQQVFEQISTYNLLLHVDYLVISNGLEHYCCKMDYEHQCPIFLEDIPDYSQLLL